jgi:hypothetical protein
VFEGRGNDGCGVVAGAGWRGVCGGGAVSIIGVTIFGDQAPDQFGAFDLAFVTMFRVAVGETWLGESLPIRLADGAANYPAVGFYVLFVLMVNWTLLQAGAAERECVGGLWGAPA